MLLKPKAYFALIARLSLGNLFAFSGFSKIMDFHSFLLTVQSFEILPSTLISPFALLIVTLESGFGLALLAGLCSRISAAILASLTGLFTIAIGMNLIQGNIINCGCFGIDEGEEIGLPLYEAVG